MRFEQNAPERLPLEDTAEFHRLADEAIAKATAKFAWVAQFEGVVLRHNPLAQRPYKHWVYNRIAKADYGFFYRGRNGTRRRWYPDLETVFGEAIEADNDNHKGIVIAERVGFLPGQDEIAHDADGCRVLNLWRPPKWKLDRAAQEPSLFIEHVCYLVDEDPDAFDHLMNFFAHLVQRPHERPAHALLITSQAKGIGKSTLGNVLRNLIGDRNAGVAQTKDLKSQFDGWIVGRLLVQVDEIYEAGNWDLANTLKPLITEQRISVNMKYGPQTEIDNFARFLLFSNHPAPISIEEGDRRYFVINSKAQPRPADYYERLNDYISSDTGMTEIFSFLSKRDLSSFKPFAPPPVTEAKREVIGVSGNPLYGYLEDAVQSGHLEEKLVGREFSLDQLLRVLQSDGWGTHARNTRELAEALKRAGVTRTRKSTENGKIRLYVLPPTVGPQLSDDRDF